ncbi:hypothetical protein EYF80_038095 [Liparis tanakae]|uniref:Uncharacterized protein n=1 Tax=Liparis tanakae TaxID=230148 RepID=A0A4Z2GFL3_9TELE|nr:hypothetical protein EYF80_038095 [Liparis tanakae]
MKGYGRPNYGAGPGAGMGMGMGMGMGVPQLARNQAYGGNGYGAQPMGGYNGGHGRAGLGLGPRYGNGGTKGPKPGYGAAAGLPNGQGAKPNGYGGMPNTKGPKSAGASHEKGLKGGVPPLEEVVAPPEAEPQGPAPGSPEPTSGILVMVTRDKYPKLSPKGKNYKQTPVIIETTPEPVPPILLGQSPTPASEPTPEPAATGPKGKGPKTAPSGPAPEDPQTHPAAEQEPVPPQGFGQGAYLGAGYRNSYGGNGNGYGAGVQPDYARMGAEKSNNKYGIGGLQFGGQPPSTEGKYGYAGSPYGPAGDAKSSRKYGGAGAGMGADPAPAQYGMAGSPYQHEPLGQHGKLPGRYGAGEVPYAPQTLGFRTEANPFEQYGMVHWVRVVTVTVSPETDAAASPYDPQPVEPDSAVVSYNPTASPAPAFPSATAALPAEAIAPDAVPEGGVEDLHEAAVEDLAEAGGEDRPEAGGEELPEAGGEDLPDPALDFGPPAESQGAAQAPEHPEELLHQQQQLPRQIHIQQHLKLHFHPQGKLML